MSVEGRTNKAPALFFLSCRCKNSVFFINICHDDLFSFPPKQAVQSSLGDFFVSYAKIQKIYDTVNQIVKFV